MRGGGADPRATPRSAPAPVDRVHVPRHPARPVRGEDRRSRRGQGCHRDRTARRGPDAVQAYLSGDAFGDAGRTCVIEEGLAGPELSIFALCDGKNAVPFAAAQDHERAFDDDHGPNTGGMGAYSPVPIAVRSLIDEVMATAIRPTLAELRSRGAEYVGVLYCGLMLTPTGPKVIEYNIRFGDPECQVLVPRLASDLYRHSAEVAVGCIETEVHVRPDSWLGSRSRPRAIRPRPRGAAT